MKYMTWIILLHVILSYSAGLGEGFSDWIKSLASIGSVVTRGRRSKRSLLEFRDVITCLQPWIDVLGCYGDYGCYCGFNGGGQPLDDTDKCCYYHDKCYDEIEKESSISYASYFSTYKFQCVDNSKIICDKNLNEDYVQRLCECDRKASECFLKERRTYNERLFDISSKYCNENPDLSDLHLGTHTLGKLYSCNMKLHDNKCCSDVGYNSEYEICCSGKVRKRKNGQSSCQSFEL